MYSSPRIQSGDGKSENTKCRSGPVFLARPKMGALKNLHSMLNSKYAKSLGSHDKKKRNKKSSPVPKMEYLRKKPDYADTAYREAVDRLRVLLAESYSGRRRILTANDISGDEDTDTQSVVSVISRTSRYPLSQSTYRKLYPIPKLLTTTYDKKDGFHSSPELSHYIERQEDYIDQLEHESKFCREELSTLLSKVKDVIQENEQLHEKQKDRLIKSVLDQFETETDTDNDLLTSSRPLTKVATMEGPPIVYESRISELEAQLTQTKIDLKKAKEERESCKHCQASGGPNDNIQSQIDRLQQDKLTLQDTVAKLQAALNTLREKESLSSDQVKRSLDIAEQAQYEKTSAEHDIRRLKDELERQHNKLREAINEQSRRVADERASVERRYTEQIEQLSNDLGVHWEQANKLQLELEKQKRENSDLRRESAQKQTLLDELRKDMQNKIVTLQSDIGVSGAEKSALEQQISALQMYNDRAERQGKQEAAQLQIEMQSLRQRLDRADADLIHSRRENLRLTEQIASLEKEINMNKALAEEKQKIIPLMAPPPKIPDEKNETFDKIQEVEAKHAVTVAELEGKIQSQNQLMDKLSAECHALTQKLDESSTRHKLEIQQLQTNLEYLSNKFNEADSASKRANYNNMELDPNTKTSNEEINSHAQDMNSQQYYDQNNMQQELYDQSGNIDYQYDDKEYGQPYETQGQEYGEYPSEDIAPSEQEVEQTTQEYNTQDLQQNPAT